MRLGTYMNPVLFCVLKKHSIYLVVGAKGLAVEFPNGTWKYLNLVG